jgi:hypothetical protein
MLVILDLIDEMELFQNFLLLLMLVVDRVVRVLSIHLSLAISFKLKTSLDVMQWLTPVQTG